MEIVSGVARPTALRGSGLVISFATCREMGCACAIASVLETEKGSALFKFLSKAVASGFCLITGG